MMNVTHFAVYSAIVYLAVLLAIVPCRNVPGAYLILHALVCLPLIGAYRKDRRRLSVMIPIFILLAGCLYKLPSDMGASLIMQETMIASTLLYLIRKGKKPAEYLSISKVRLPLLLLMPVETVLLLIPAYFVNLCSGIFFKDHVTETLQGAAGHFPAAVLVICIGPALSEEILFRGGIFTSAGKTGRGVLLSAALFAVWHMDPRQMTYAFLVGILLALMAERTGSLVCCILTHFLFNLYNLAASALPQDSAAGQGLYFMEKVCRMLVPSFFSGQGQFLWMAFLRGLAVSIVSILIYLRILQFCADQRKEADHGAVPA